MLVRVCSTRLSAVVVFCVLAAGLLRADTLVKIVSPSAQGASDSLNWAQEGADGTILGATFSASTASSTAVTVSLAGPNSIVSVVCTANPCSWTGTGFTAGHSLLWTSDAGNGSNGPVSLSFAKNIAGAGAFIQADTPGAFTAQIALFNGSTSLGSYTMASDNAGDPLYLGAVDQTGANITSVVFSLTSCSNACTDFAVDTVAVNTAAAGASATVSPASLAFPTTVVGSTSPTQNVTLKNTGGTLLNITSILSSGSGGSSFLIPTRTCGTTLAAGASCSFAVTFKPAAAGALTAVVLVTDNANGSPQQVNVSGTGQAAPATVTLTPASLSFPATAVGSTSTSQAVTLKNTGSTTVSISSIASTGINASSFLIPAKTCGTSLTAGASCTFSVAFKPAAAGGLSAVIQVSDNATGSPQKVNVSGTGQGTSSGLTINPTNLSFGAGFVGTTTPAQAVTITNSGSGTVTMHSISLTGASSSSFLELNTCGPTLAPSVSCAVAVSFKPAALGSLSAALSVSSSASATAQTVALSGTASAQPALTFSTTALHFATTLHGTTSPASLLTITNTGTSTAGLTLITLGGANPTDFAELSTCGPTLATGAACKVFLSFKPVAAGSFSASLIVYDNAAGAPHVTALTGTGN